jgi:membrane glycosyltransferase
MLALPRVMGALAIVLRREQGAYGGIAALARGTVLEGGLSVLQAPVRMIAHSLFVVAALTGLKLEWKSPPREAQDIGWKHAAGRFGLVGTAAAALAGWGLLQQPDAVLLLLPTGLPLMLAVPLTVLTSRSTIGQRLLALRLLLTPEEHLVPTVLTFTRGR